MKKRNSFITTLSLILGMIGIFLIPAYALASYPEKPVTLICVWGAGGANDSIARNIAETMKKYFPQPVVVVNRAGGAGTVGTAEVLRAKPDGYMIGSTTTTSLTIEPHRLSLPYNTPNDYTPIALVGTQVYGLIVHDGIPCKTLKDFVEYTKARPGKIRLGTGGTAHITHLIMEQLNMLAKIDLMDLPFKGGGEKMAAFLGKHFESSVTTFYETLPHAQAGKVKVLAIADEKRSPLFPDVPTFKEQGYDITTATYTLLIGPKGLPAEVVSKIQDAFKKVSKDPDFLKFMEAQGVTVLYEGTEELTKRLWDDYRTNEKLLERLGLKKK